MRLARAMVGRAVVALVVEGGHGRIIDQGDDVDLIALAMDGWKGEPGPLIDLDTIRLLAPVQPRTVRDFMAFEGHVAAGRRAQSLDMDPRWYEHPSFYFGNIESIFGPGDEITRPRGSRQLDYELEVACIIGREATESDIHDDDWTALVAGFTLMNDWSARDLQIRDMAQGLGPGKGKDFALSLGPYLVTPDELAPVEGGRPATPISASVNGEEWSSGDLADIYFSWPEILRHAAENTRLMPGDVIGSGTCAGGCIFEHRLLGDKTRHWLRDGDVVQLASPRLGTLVNRVADFRPDAE